MVSMPERLHQSNRGDSENLAQEARGQPDAALKSKCWTGRESAVIRVGDGHACLCRRPGDIIVEQEAANPTGVWQPSDLKCSK